MDILGRVVAAIVVATARYTKVATITQINTKCNANASRNDDKKC
jgi:hypothetical protein